MENQINGKYEFIYRIGYLGFYDIRIEFSIDKNGKLTYEKPIIER